MSSSPAAPGASTASLSDFHRPVRKVPHEAVTATADRVEHAQYRDRAGQPDRRRTYAAAYCVGLTTAAEPPPRRTGSAAATTRPSGRNQVDTLWKRHSRALGYSRVGPPNKEEK